MTRTRVSEIFSPLCDCATNAARISFRLRRADTLTLEILDDRRALVRTLVFRQPLGRGIHAFAWNGRDDAGAIARDGTYRVRLELSDQRRTILLPNRILLDATRPVVRALRARPRVISPDGDGRRDSVRIDYRLSEQAQALVLVDGVQRVRTHARKTRHYVRWQAENTPPGLYSLSLGSEDKAGNLAEPRPAGVVRVRYVELARRRITARAGRLFRVRVATDARAVRWRFGNRRGTLRGRVLIVRAGEAGRRFLYVTANGHSDRALVVVR